MLQLSTGLNASTTQRFREVSPIYSAMFSSSSAADDDHNYHTCVRYMGSIGGTAAKRGKWFHSWDDIGALREAIRQLCPRNESLVSCCLISSILLWNALNLKQI